MSQKTLERLECLRKLNSNKQWVNNNLYRLMYQEDLYILAYERLKSKPGNMTKGARRGNAGRIFAGGYPCDHPGHAH